MRYFVLYYKRDFPKIDHDLLAYSPMVLFNQNYFLQRRGGGARAAGGQDAALMS